MQRLLVPNRASQAALTFAPILCAALVACANASSAPSLTPSGDAAAETSTTGDAAAETSTTGATFTLAGSSLTKLTYTEGSFMPHARCASLGFYDRLTFDLDAKTVHVESCNLADFTDAAAATTDETRALSDENVATAREMFKELELLPLSSYGECNAYDGLNRVLSVEGSARNYVVSNPYSCSGGPTPDAIATKGFDDVRAKLYELAGLPVPMRAN